MRYKLETMGNMLMTSSTYSPELNSSAEKMKGTLLDKVGTLIKEANLPLQYWGEALQHAVFLHNRTVTSFLDMWNPCEVLLGTTPKSSSINKFGYSAYMHVHKQNHNTELHNYAEKGFYLSSMKSLYRIQSFLTKLVVETKHVSFQEERFLFAKKREACRKLGTNFSTSNNAKNDTRKLKPTSNEACLSSSG